MGLFDLFRRKRPTSDEELHPSIKPVPLSEIPPLPPLSPGPAVPPEVTEEATLAARDVVDRLQLLHPQHQGTLRLIADFSHGDARMAMTEVPTVGESRLPEWVVLDLGLHEAFLAWHIARLLETLGLSLDGLQGVELRVDGDVLELFGARITIDPSTLLFGLRFCAVLDDVGQQLDARQEALQARMGALGGCAVHWDRPARSLVLTNEAQQTLTVFAEPLGSFAPELATWCWAWANDSFESELTAAIAEVRDSADEGGPLPVLTRPEFSCCEPFAFTVAYLGAFRMSGKAVWRWPLRSGVQLFFAIDAE